MNGVWAAVGSDAHVMQHVRQAVLCPRLLCASCKLAVQYNQQSGQDSPDVAAAVCEIEEPVSASMYGSVQSQQHFNGLPGNAQ